MKIDNRKLILSKHLISVRNNKGQVGILNRNNGIALQVTADLLSFLKHFQQPISLEDAKRKFAIDGLEKKIYSLWKSKFILFFDQDEEIEYLEHTRLTINKSRTSTKNFFVYHPEDVIFPIPILSTLLEEVYSHIIRRGLKKLHRKAIIFVCNTQNEFDTLWGDESLPSHVNVFVSHSRVIAIKPDFIYSLISADERIFKAMVHEMIHIFLCEHYTNLPVWCTEGLCEYFSAYSYDVSLNELIRSKGLYHFSEVTGMTQHSILDIDSSEIETNIAYRQSKQFIEYLAETLGEDRLLECVFSTGLSKRFESNFREFFPYSLKHYEIEWRKSLGVTR